MLIEVIIDSVTNLRLATLAAARGVSPGRVAAGLLSTVINYGERKKPRKKRKPVSEETREKLRRSHQGHRHSPETRERMRLRALGHVVSEATRQKIRVYQTAHPENPWRFQPGHPPVGHAIPKIPKSGR